MNLKLKDRVVLVSGGAKGIGAAITKCFAQEGAIPVVVDRDVHACEVFNSDLESEGLSARFVQQDLSFTENCKEVVQHIHSEFKRIDVLVNNAGINDKVGLENGSPEEFLCSLQRNLLHYFNMAHFALPHLKTTRGCVINISSKTAVTGQGGTSGYACSKGAILALTREWAAELLAYGIRVNAIVPAEVKTPLYEQWLQTFPNPNERLKLILSKIPLGKRMTTPQEIATMVVFLASDLAGHITGQHLFIDGGYVHLDRALT